MCLCVCLYTSCYTRLWGKQHTPIDQAGFFLIFPKEGGGGVIGLNKILVQEIQFSDKSNINKQKIRVLFCVCSFACVYIVLTVYTVHAIPGHLQHGTDNEFAITTVRKAVDKSIQPRVSLRLLMINDTVSRGCHLALLSAMQESCRPICWQPLYTSIHLSIYHISSIMSIYTYNLYILVLLLYII